MRVREFQSELWLPPPPADLFPFFADAANLEALTPSWLNFKIVTPTPIPMREGTLIDYHLRVRGVPLRWRTRINVWQPPQRFVDEQIRGPYRRWVHLHGFREVPGGVEVSDRVEYALPFGPLGDLVHALVVRRQLNAIFAFRRRAMEEMFGTIEP